MTVGWERSKMQIRKVREEDAEAACVVLRRSITELCRTDYREDAATLAEWLANKTLENVRTWIGNPGYYMLVADDGGTILGVGAIQSSGRISLNYVSPDARFRGVSKALMFGLEAKALELGLAACTLESTETARQFYLAMGYSETGPATAGFGVGICYPMVKMLAPR
jgi:predicted GNAT family acetyltransferase